MSIFRRIKIRSRLIIAIIVPVLLTACVVSALTSYQMKKSGEQEIAQLESILLSAKKEALKDVVDSVESMVKEAEQSGVYESQAALENAVRDRIRSVNFSNGNYVFAYKLLPDGELFNLAYRPDPNKEGVVDPKNAKLQTLLRDLFKAAEKSEYYGYTWPNPATGQVEPKVSYSTILPGYGWMIGAGVYTNDVAGVVDSAKAELASKINASLKLIAFVTLGVVIISLVVGYLVGKTVTGPLDNAIEMMKEIAKGEGNLTLRLPDAGRDELAELGENFNAFVTRIQYIIKRVGETTNDVSSSSQNMNEVAEQTRESVKTQSCETDKIAQAINEMAETIRSISESANEVQSHGADADRLSRESGEVMKGSQEVVHNLSNNILDSAQVIESLAARTNEIQSVLDVIHEVTDQTNLLALNAAIEAARAGEHGRGFAVVADEVRQLARRSDESASQIREMIDGFITESNKAVENMRSSKSLSDQTVERINHASEALDTIAQSVEKIHDQIAHIASGSEQQSQVAEEITKNIDRIIKAAQNSETGVNRTSEASQSLAQLSDDLKKLIDQFKV